MYEISQKMIKKLPVYERKSSVITGVIDGYASEFQREDVEINRIYQNLFLDTMDERGIAIHERDFGVRLNKNLTLEQKRIQIIGMWQSIFGAMTEERFKYLVRLLTGSPYVSVDKTDVDGWFLVTIEVKEDLKNYDEVKYFVDIKFPAHLVYYFNFLYRNIIKVRQTAVSLLVNIEYSGDKTDDEFERLYFNNMRIESKQYAISLLDSPVYSGEKENIQEDRK